MRPDPPFFLWFVAALTSPYTGSVYQQASSIPFVWSDITPAESNCLSQATQFYYQFSVWNSTAIQSATPVFTTDIKVVCFLLFPVLFWSFSVLLKIPPKLVDVGRRLQFILVEPFEHAGRHLLLVCEKHS